MHGTDPQIIGIDKGLEKDKTVVVWVDESTYIKDFKEIRKYLKRNIASHFQIPQVYIGTSTNKDGFYKLLGGLKSESIKPIT